MRAAHRLQAVAAAPEASTLAPRHELSQSENVHLHYSP
jgi:hypothetical protein